MNRRLFMGLLGGGVAGLALDQAIPFNRVWSFPKEIVVAKLVEIELAAGFDWSYDPGTSVIVVERWALNHEKKRIILHRGVVAPDGKMQMLAPEDTAYDHLPFGIPIPTLLQRG